MPPSSDPVGHAENSVLRLRKIARGGALMLAGSGIEAAFGFGLAIVAGRLLGKHDFGLFNLAWQIIALSLILSELGLPVSVMRSVAVLDGEDDPEGAKGAALGGTVLSALLGILLALVLIFGAKPLATRVFQKADLASILPIMAIQLPLVGVMTTMMRITQARATMRYRVMVEKILLPGLRLLLIGLALASGARLKGAAWGSTIACALTLAIAVHLTWGVMQQAWGSARPRWRELGPVAMYAVPLVLSSLALFGRRRGIMIVLGAVGSGGQVGLYAAAERAAITAAMGLNAIGAIFSPIAADLYNRGQHGDLHAILKASAAWIVMVVLPGALLLALCAPEVLSAFGRDFPEAAIALTVLAVAQIINCTYGSVDYLIAMSAKQWIAVVDLSLFAFVSMGLTYCLVPKMGVVGAAIAGAVGLLGPRTVRLIQVAVLLRMTPFGWGHLRVSLAVLPSTLLALLWRSFLRPVLPTYAFWWLLLPTYAALYLLMLSIVAPRELNALRAAILARRTAFKPHPAEGLEGEPGIGRVRARSDSE